MFELSPRPLLQIALIMIFRPSGRKICAGGVRNREKSVSRVSKSVPKISARCARLSPNLHNWVRSGVNTVLRRTPPNTPFGGARDWRRASSAASAANNYQNLAEARDQGHRHLLRERGVRWRPVYRSHGTALWTCFDQSNRHPISELFF